MGKTSEQILCQRRHRWQISIWKDVEHHVSLGYCKLKQHGWYCKLKQQWDTTTQLLEWWKSRTLTTPNADKDVEQQQLPRTAGGNAKMVQPLWNIVWWLLTKLNIVLPYVQQLHCLIFTEMNWKYKSKQKSACECL